MMSYLPPYYQDSAIISAIIQVRGAEVDKVRDALDEILAQFYIQTATWNLERWEDELGIPPNPAMTDSERRQRLIDHLTGYDTCDAALIKTIAAKYENGEIEVIEDFAGYIVIIRFVGTKGQPPNLSQLQDAIRNIVPAHLDLQYELTYLTWEELDAAGKTWDQFDALGLTWDQLEVYNF